MPSLIESGSGSDATEPTANRADLSMWSPCIVIHTPGEVLQAYQKVIPELMASGALKCVRISVTKGEGKNFVNEWIASSTGLDILWVLDNYYLFDPNIEQVVDQVMAWYPSIRYLEIGNETTTILLKNGPQISIETYMGTLKRIYAYVQTRYPNVILLTQSTFGSGTHGALELEKMVELGLRDMSPNKLIIAMNVYSIASASHYSSVVNRLGLRKQGQSYRIWVTETGITDPNNHIGFVQEMYPYLTNVLRPERIFWYCLYCGEAGQYGDHHGYGLIREVAGSSFWKSPLYWALAKR